MNEVQKFYNRGALGLLIIIILVIWIAIKIA